MTAATVTLGFDISALTTRAIAQMSKADDVWKLTFFSSTLKVVSNKLLRHVATAAANAVIERVDHLSAKVAPHAVFFEGAKEILIEQMALTSLVPDDRLRAQIDKLHPKNIEFIEMCDKIIAQLTSLNPTSRVASAFGRLRSVVVRIDESTQRIRSITDEGITHIEVFTRMHGLQKSMDEKIHRYLEDEEFDPELIALADAALSRISAGAKDPSTATRI